MADVVPGEISDEAVTAESTDVNQTAEGTSPPEQVQDQDANAAESSAAKKDDGPKSMLDAVNTALAGSKEKSPTSESGSEAEAKPKGTETDKDADEFTPQEWAHLPQKTRKSIERFRSQISEFKQQLTEVQPKVAGFDQLVDFVNRSNLTPQELDAGLNLMALMKNKPEQAYEQLVPLMVQLQGILGLALPDDLKKEVEQGFITEERAREISTLRAQGKLTETRSAEDNARRSTQEHETALRGQVDTVAKSATDWENAKAKSDPDWNLKKDRVAELVELDLNRKQRANPQWFPSAQQAIEMSEAALKKVNDELKRFGTPRKAISPVTGSASQSSRPKPKNILDVINNVVG